jgi:hypothetical protein
MIQRDGAVGATEDGMMKLSNSMDPNTDQPFDTSPPWLETQAEVTACRYEFAKLNALTLGIAPDSNRFLISFTYYAQAKIFNGEFTSPVAVEQSKAFPIFYNPLNPQQHRQSISGFASPMPLIAIGVAVSLAISLLYLAIMHGSN